MTMKVDLSEKYMETAIKCPYCGHDYMHVKYCFDVDEKQHMDKYRERPRHGLRTGGYKTCRVVMECEGCGERPVLSVLGHKGQVYLQLTKYSE